MCETEKICDCHDCTQARYKSSFRGQLESVLPQMTRTMVEATVTEQANELGSAVGRSEIRLQHIENKQDWLAETMDRMLGSLENRLMEHDSHSSAVAEKVADNLIGALRAMSARIDLFAGIADGLHVVNQRLYAIEKRIIDRAPEPRKPRRAKKGKHR
jgi:hypothetical protein